MCEESTPIQHIGWSKETYKDTPKAAHTIPSQSYRRYESLTVLFCDAPEQEWSCSLPESCGLTGRVCTSFVIAHVQDSTTTPFLVLNWGSCSSFDKAENPSTARSVVECLVLSAY